MAEQYEDEQMVVIRENTGFMVTVLVFICVIMILLVAVLVRMGGIERSLNPVYSGELGYDRYFRVP